MRLQIKIILILGITFFTLLLAVVSIVFFDFRSHEIENAEERAELILNRNLATHQYFTEQLKPSVFPLAEETVSEEYFAPTWMSSTYAVREIDKIYQQLSDKNYYYKEAAIDARSPQNEANSIEQDFIEKLNRNKEVEKKTLVRTIEGKKYFQLLKKGETMQANCLRCHSTPAEAPQGLVDKYGPERSFHREEGEVISAISIRVPLEYIYTQYADRFNRMIVLMVLMLGLFSFVAYIMTKKFILDPLHMILMRTQDIFDKPRRIFEPHELNFSKEINELAQSLNSMSERLGYHIENLDTIVDDQTKSLQNAVEEKDYLMKELNHRVKNNLFMVASLIGLKNAEIENSGVDLSDIQHQIDAIRIVHEKLHQTEDVTSINFRDYAQDLLETIFDSFSSHRVVIENTIEKIVIGTDKAIPLGLLINEVATNAIKYGFSNKEEARFAIRMYENLEQKAYVLQLSNSGNPFPEKISLEHPDTLGLQLITSLVSQLGGTIELQKEPNPVFTIQFPIGEK